MTYVVMVETGSLGEAKIIARDLLDTVRPFYGVHVRQILTRGVRDGSMLVGAKEPWNTTPRTYELGDDIYIPDWLWNPLND